VAGVADISALVTNPAGLGWMNGSELSGSFLLSNVETVGRYNSPGYSSSLTDDLSDATVGNIGYAFKVPTSQGSMVLGVSFNQVHSFNRALSYDGDNGFNSVTDYLMPFADEFELIDDNGDVFPEFNRTLSFIAFETFAIDLSQELLDAGEAVPFQPAVSFGTVAQSGFLEDIGEMYELNFGGALEVSKDVMVGGSLNIPMGSFERLRVLNEDDYLNDNDGQTNGTTDFAFLQLSESLRTDMVGVNARFGVSAKAGKRFHLGATIETPTLYAIEESYSTRLETEFDNGDLFVYGDEVGESAGSGEFDYTLTTPWKLSAGASINWSNFTFYFDTEWVDWSQLELDSETYGFESENLEIRNVLQSSVNARFGATYDMGKWQFRLGSGVYEDPRTARPFVSEGFPDVDRERVFGSFGVGYEFSDKLQIDLAWLAEEFDDRNDLYSDVSDAPFVSEQVTNARFQFGLKFGL